MSNRTEGRRIAIAYGPGLNAAAVNALAERIDRAIGAAKKRGEERGWRKAGGCVCRDLTPTVERAGRRVCGECDGAAR